MYICVCVGVLVREGGLYQFVAHGTQSSGIMLFLMLFVVQHFII